MKLVYEASHSVEAHMILNLLEQAGLQGRIDGEYLQGGMGELPAAGLIRVMVSESDYDAAKEIIDIWEKSQPALVEKKPKSTSHKRSFLSGLVTGTIIIAIFYNTPITEDGIDYNNDGKLDEKWTYIDDRISKSEIDRNFDGKVDYIYKYNRKELIKYSESDDDFNGKFETRYYYERGNIIWSISDTTGDGFEDYRVDYWHGVTDTVTFINKITKKPVKIQKFSANKLISAKLDTNGDGVLDTLIEYDGIEEIIKKSRI